MIWRACNLQAASLRLADRCKFVDSGTVGVQGMLCRTPDGRLLFDRLSFTVPYGVSMLIMGPSGSGKSSLLRIIAGLWPVDEGSIHRPNAVGKGGIFFVPQRPYIPQGSLRIQVLYPHTLEQQAVPDVDLKVCVSSHVICVWCLVRSALDGWTSRAFHSADTVGSGWS